MLVLVYRIILAILSLSELTAPKHRSTPRFKRVVLELVVYPMLLVGLTVWLIWLVFQNGIHGLDIPSIVALVVAQEALIDTIIINVSKRLDVAVKDGEKS